MRPLQSYLVAKKKTCFSSPVLNRLFFPQKDDRALRTTKVKKGTMAMQPLGSRGNFKKLLGNRLFFWDWERQILQNCCFRITSFFKGNNHTFKKTEASILLGKKCVWRYHPKSVCLIIWKSFAPNHEFFQETIHMFRVHVPFSWRNGPEFLRFTQRLVWKRMCLWIMTWMVKQLLTLGQNNIKLVEMCFTFMPTLG